MIEQAIPVVLAAITGGAVMINRVHNQIHALDRRMDQLELKVSENYVTKTDFYTSINSIEDWMLRIEAKIDRLVEK